MEKKRHHFIVLLSYIHKGTLIGRETKKVRAGESESESESES